LSCLFSYTNIQTLPSHISQVDGQAVLKVALADTPYPRLAAVATVAGIYALDLQPCEFFLGLRGMLRVYGEVMSSACGQAGSHVPGSC
jgi:hypothetical protein